MRYARVSRVSAFYRELMGDPQMSHFIQTNPAAQASPVAGQTLHAI